jgi:prevent-host-death family protein
MREEGAMEISVTAAKGQLTELVRRAEAGEQIVLTRHGKPAARLTSIATPAEAERRRKFLAEISRRGAKAITPGPDAAHSADFLYDDDGLPA